MMGFLFLGVACLAAASGGGYLLHVSREGAKAREKERRELRNSFRASLARELRKTKASRFGFSDLVTNCGIERSEADAVAEEFYGGYCQKVFSDGVVSEDERRVMDRLAGALEISPEAASSIEGRSRDARYRAAVTSALGDGRISGEELEELESLRRSLGMSRGQGLALTETISRDAFVAEMRRIVRGGQFSPEIRENLAKFKRALAISDADAPQFLARHATDLYRECFTMAVQDGVITAEERQMLEWLLRPRPAYPKPTWLPSGKRSATPSAARDTATGGFQASKPQNFWRAERSATGIAPAYINTRRLGMSFGPLENCSLPASGSCLSLQPNRSHSLPRRFSI